MKHGDINDGIIYVMQYRMLQLLICVEYCSIIYDNVYQLFEEYV